MWTIASSVRYPRARKKELIFMEADLDIEVLIETKRERDATS